MRAKALFKAYSKGAAALAALLCVTLFSGCSKDNKKQASGYSTSEKEALQVLNGTFSYDGGMTSTTIVFSPFPEPVQKKSTMNDVEMDFYGTMDYHSTYYDDSFYFYLDTDLKQIVAYSQHSEKKDYFNALVGKIWEYTIVDENTIKLFDTELSDPTFHTNTFIRE